MILNIPENKRTSLSKPPPLKSFLPPAIQSKKQKTNALPRTSWITTYDHLSNVTTDATNVQHAYYSMNNNYTPLQSNHKENLQFNSIGDFLMKLGDPFLQYESNFIDNGYTVDLLSHLTLGQLKDIGVKF
ncbi:unnamed protein product [Rhizophagus irregularis]|uniref:SAM domain-containing protein n=1 Tax=Rhizophagus irregularis TaxID=588596 RepID=A0A2I1H4T5_9GLOM|nr:hypothetical protein RhiirA4_472319 [Rhizophagus irregularis]CAB4434237.1 unnamed protein product [Rhizophagus irregularis]